MNQIIKSLLNHHIQEYGITNLAESTAFEHFVNRCIVNKYLEDRFDPDDIMTGEGEVGIDGIAVIVNGILIKNIVDLEAVCESAHQLDVKFVFIQSKTSENFSGSEISTFIYGVKNFFIADDSKRQPTNEKIENLVKMSNVMYEKYSENFKEPPAVYLYYVCCGQWNEDNHLQYVINEGLSPLRERSDIRDVKFFPYDADRIRITHRELQKKVTRILPIGKKIAFPDIMGIKQAYVGIVTCKDYLSLLIDDEGNMLPNIFEDNVRDFQGYNPVNSGIRDTIKNKAEQERFAVFNNGITIVTKKLDVKGDSIELTDYQIVNGCQSSYILYDNRNELSKTSSVIVKIIEVEDEDISDKIIVTTNRQTEVKLEAFIATSNFQKELQDIYDSYPSEIRLYYERRSKQYDLESKVSKNKVITLTWQIKCYIAMFLNEPHSTHRYYGELLKAYSAKIFLDDDYKEIYFIAAYYSYYVLNKGKCHNDKFVKEYKYYIICAMRAYICGKEIFAGNKKQQKKQYKSLYQVIEDKSIERVFKIARSCLEELVHSLDSKVANNRSKELTQKMLSKILELKKEIDNPTCLEKSSEVHCIVVSKDKYKVEFDIKTSDKRNKGYVLGSFVGKWEITQGERFKAEIVSDCYDSKKGWKLKLKDKLS